jgi:radical SAM superfamily enzyme YgiQ (UPF0313 family)
VVRHQHYFFISCFWHAIFYTAEVKANSLLANQELDKNLKRFVTWVKEKSPNCRLIAGGARKFFLENYGFSVFHFYSDREIVEYTKWCENPSGLMDAKFSSNLINGSEFREFTESKIVYDKTDLIFPQESLPIEISRGCIFKCKFCGFPLNGKNKGDYIKTTQTFRDELVEIYETHGVTDYMFSDDTYNESDYKVKLLYDEVFSKLPFKIQFTTYIRLDLIMRYPDMIEYLPESGLLSALFGIETINHDSGKIIGKGIDPLLQFDFVREIKRNRWQNVMTHSGIIVGLPAERPDEFELLEEFLLSDKNSLDQVDVSALGIYPVQDKTAVHRSWQSSFDLEYEKYGYQCFTDESGKIKWRNSLTNMTWDQANEFAEKINKMSQDSDRFRHAGFGYPMLKSIGIHENDLRTLSKRQISQKYNLKALVDSRKKLYRNSLLKLL